MQMPKRIVRKKEAWLRLGCGHTKFHEAYVLHDPAVPFVPGTQIPRLRPVPIGVRNIGFLDHEIDTLIDAIAALRDTAPARPRTTRALLTDARPPKLEQERRAREPGGR
jgi:predicted DNA-binding transcriptional regulator AlpA